MSFVHDLDLNEALSLNASRVNYINNISEENVIRYGNNRPLFIERSLYDYGMGMITHPNDSEELRLSSLNAFDVYMGKFGEYASAELIGDMLTIASQRHDYQTLDILTNYITDKQITQIPDILAEALIEISHLHQEPSFNSDIHFTDTNIQEALADTIENFLIKFGDIIDPADLREVLINFANNDNSIAVDTILENISDSQISEIGPEVINRVVGDIVIRVDNSFVDGFNNGNNVVEFTDVQSAINFAAELRERGYEQNHIVIQVEEGRSNHGEPYGHFTVDVSNITIKGIGLPRFETQDLPTDNGAPYVLRENGKAVFGVVNVMEQSDVTIDGLYIAQSHNIGIYVSGEDTLNDIPDQIYSNISIINNVVENTDTAGISVTGTRVFSDNPRITEDGTHEHYLENILIQNNNVSFTNVGAGNTEAISLGAGTNNFQIIGNTVHDTEQYGIDVKTGAKDGVIAQNHVYNVERFGIYLDAANRTIENIVIEDNLVHNVRNGITLARETNNPFARDVGTERVDEQNVQTVDSNFVNIDINNNTIFSTEGHGVLVYRHFNKDGHDGTFDVNINDNTIFDWGMNSTEAKYNGAQAIQVHQNLTDVEIIRTQLESKGQTTEINNLDALIINGVEIIHNGLLNSEYDMSSNTNGIALNDIVNSNNNILSTSRLPFTGSSDDTAPDHINSQSTTEDDILFGGEGNNFMRGLNGDDIMYGGDGDDTVIGDRGNDILIGDGANSSYFNWDLMPNTEFMVDSGNDILLAGAGDDVLIGLGGDDTLRGAAGNDVMYGNEGADTFVFRSGDFDDFDTIKDFSVDENDVIDISAVLSDFDPLEDALTDFVEITSDGENSIVSVDIDGGGTDFQQILLLEAASDLNALELVNNGNLLV